MLEYADEFSRSILLPSFFSFLSRSLWASIVEAAVAAPVTAVALSPQLSRVGTLRVLAEEDEENEVVAAAAAPVKEVCAHTCDRGGRGFEEGVGESKEEDAGGGLLAPPPRTLERVGVRRVLLAAADAAEAPTRAGVDALLLAAAAEAGTLPFAAVLVTDGVVKRRA
jgi:hypothetical protein